MPFVDLVICGSVAADRNGVRVGKGLDTPTSKSGC